MTASSARAVPVALCFPAPAGRLDAWGRFMELFASGGKVASLALLERGEKLALSFEVGDEAFKALSAEIIDARQDADGYYWAELRFLDEVEKRRLSRALLDILSR
ncbi:MAG: hypothetical protein A3J74_06615 [Elusimicrobia bacterium RIFCSPHIGHO2_02_FULL_57_9]|nr:MAG: hypothetical protein A3J74_06615 [Elusimicrobia bacterium RIFCSPHIGHO2_02_FULL_57_9]